MHSMTDGFGLPRTSSLLDRWGHWSPQLLMAAIASMIVRTPSTSATALLLSAAVLAFVIVTCLLMRQHDRRLCEACVAAIPLDPSAQAARYTWRLWLVHRGADPRIAVPFVVLVSSTNFLTSPTGRVFWALALSSVIYLIAAMATHRRLQPWCPWCSGGGGADRLSSSDPDSPRGGRRQLV
jgi:hypothetical protein